MRLDNPMYIIKLYMKLNKSNSSLRVANYTVTYIVT